MIATKGWTTTDWILAAVEAIIWYGFICYFLYSIKNSVNIYQSALILLVMAYVAAICCPWTRRMLKFISK